MSLYDNCHDHERDKKWFWFEKGSYMNESLIASGYV
jgi:hypothetical protein